MKAHSQDIKSLRKDVYALRRSLQEDIKELREARKGFPLLPTTSIQHFSKVQKIMRDKAVSKMDKTELSSIYRQLKYIRGLKSSTLQGAMETAQRFEPIRKNIESLSKVKQDEWWQVYGELYKQFSGYEKYKYEIFDVIDTMIDSSSSDEIISNIINSYTDILLEADGSITDEEIAVLFTEKLKSFLK